MKFIFIIILKIIINVTMLVMEVSALKNEVSKYSNIMKTGRLFLIYK